VLSAPAGFGKTTALTEWLATVPAEASFVAWLSLDHRDNDPALDPVLEIYQGARQNYETKNAPRGIKDGEEAKALGGYQEAGLVWNAWKKGYRIGVIASSDHYSTHIAYAMVYTPSTAREAIFNSIRQRHTYGATDNIVLDYRMQTGGKEYLQGDIVKAGGDFTLSVKVIGTAPIRQIDIVRNNKFIHNRQPLEKEVSFTFIDNQPSPGESYYYVRVIQVDDQMAWSSPIWIAR